MAASLYHTPTRIARIRSTEYLNREEVFSADNFCVDYSICPEQILTEYITKLLIKRGGHEARFAEFDAAYASGHFQGGHE